MVDGHDEDRSSHLAVTLSRIQSQMDGLSVWDDRTSFYGPLEDV